MIRGPLVPKLSRRRMASKIEDVRDGTSYTIAMAEVGTARETAVAVEFVAPGISAASGINEFVAEIFAREPHVRDYEYERRGYLILDLQRSKAQSDWFLLDGVGKEEGNQSFWAAWAVMDGASSLDQMNGPETDNDDAPDLAPAQSGHRPQQR